MPKELTISIGSRVIYTSNTLVNKGLVNSAIGTVRDIIWKTGQDPDQESLYTIIVEFDNSQGLEYNRQKAVLIFLIIQDTEVAKAAGTRTIFPLRITFAIIIHKSQGLTLEQIVVDLKKGKLGLGAAYISISRVKIYQGLIFVYFLDIEKFRITDSILTR